MSTTTTAELARIDAAPVEQADEFAQKLDAEIRQTAATFATSYAQLQELVAMACEREIHKALGYSSWTAYLSDAMDGQLASHTPEGRQKALEFLRSQGMSAAAISKITGLSKATVKRRVAKLPSVKVLGLDGKSYIEPSRQSGGSSEPRPAAKVERDDNVIDVEVLGVEDAVIESHVVERHVSSIERDADPFDMANEDIEGEIEALESVDAQLGLIFAAAEENGVLPKLAALHGKPLRDLADSISMRIATLEAAADGA